MTLRPALLLCSLLALPLIALSQPPAPPPEDAGPWAGHHALPSPDRVAEHLQHKLGLSDDQTARLRKQIEDYSKNMQKLHDKHEAAMKKILTPEQFARLEELHQERHEHFRSRMHKSGEQPTEPAPDEDSE